MSRYCKGIQWIYGGGGVDLRDMLISLYKTTIKTKRWYLKVLFQPFFYMEFFSSGKRVKSHDSAEKLSRSHGKPENYKKQKK